MDSKTGVPVVGGLLTFIGAVHTVMGIVVWATQEQDSELSFWFTAFGVVAVGMGIAVIEVERARGFVTVPILAAIVVLAAFGLLYMPVSGFLSLLLPLAFGVVGRVKSRTVGAAAT
ncbi:hypothetical protein HGA13_11195 [Nocardia speluncae]|uniref:DUF4064 domain-containing protein n=1 Tax=Nocardia speluncae TaxID=419477 RepID=A0A846XE26_9NOCA|nr:DUF6463 family protein [Nocardia speluncae]NKY33637.1 hypothetical protein [Nocardia speluncae]